MYTKINGYPVQDFLNWGKKQGLISPDTEADDIEYALSRDELDYLSTRMVEEKGEFFEPEPAKTTKVKLFQIHEGVKVLTAYLSVENPENDTAALERSLLLTQSFGKLSWTSNTDVNLLPNSTIPIRNTQEGDFMKIENRTYILGECGFTRILA